MCLPELLDEVPGLLHVLGPGLQGCTRHLVVVNVFSSFLRLLDVNVDVVTFTGCDKERSKDCTNLSTILLISSRLSVAFGRVDKIQIDLLRLPNLRWPKPFFALNFPTFFCVCFC